MDTGVGDDDLIFFIASSSLAHVADGSLSSHLSNITLQHVTDLFGLSLEMLAM